MTWTSKVRPAVNLRAHCPSLSSDQEWVDALNAERKAQHLDKITYETFEIVMDRLEKEWFDLVSSSGTGRHASYSRMLSLRADQEHPEDGHCSAVRRLYLCYLR